MSQPQEQESNAVQVPETVSTPTSSNRRPRTTIPFHKDSFIQQLKERYADLTKQLAEYNQIMEEAKTIQRAIRVLSGEKLTPAGAGRPPGVKNKPKLDTSTSIRPTRLTLLKLINQQEDWIDNKELARQNKRLENVAGRDANYLMKAGLIEQRAVKRNHKSVVEYRISEAGRALLTGAESQSTQPSSRPSKYEAGKTVNTSQLLELIQKSPGSTNAQIGQMAEDSFQGIRNSQQLRNKLAVQVAYLRSKKYLTTSKDKQHTITAAGRKYLAESL